MTSRRSLWPREHGAYAQLGAPLASALLARTPTAAALLLALGAIGAFLANEPLLVLLGHRGRRMREQDGSRARVRLIALASLALLTGASGLALGGASVLAAAAFVALPALALVLVAYRRAQHSIGGELLAAVALPGLAVPVGVASGISLVGALVLWAAWSTAYVASVVAVHRVIARHRAKATAVDVWHTAAFLVVTVGAVAIARFSDVAAVALPVLALATLIVVRPPPATRLRALGVGLVGMSGVSVALAAAAL
jgi:hypothetical protein